FVSVVANYIRRKLFFLFFSWRLEIAATQTKPTFVGSKTLIFISPRRWTLFL
ncbi:MAG: hypothetical protein RLZZ115_2683, partial [Cyanobacteriota bacterium]